MNHFVPPEGEMGDALAKRLGVHAMDVLIKALMKLGAERRRLQAKVFGACNALPGLGGPRGVAARNAAFIERFLGDEQIPIVAQKLRAETVVNVVFDTDTGRARVRELAASKLDGIERTGAVGDPIAARAAIERFSPDVLTLDVETPKMGLTFLEQRMRARPMPVVMVSSLTEHGGEIALRARELGAVDIVTKPKIDVTRGTVERAEEILHKVKAAGRPRVCGPRAPLAPHAPVARRPTRPPTSLRTMQKIVALGASTGGTEALREVLVAMPADAPAIIVVQHMPPRFTRQFAQRLDGLCRVRVREARDGDALLQGHVLVAPGGDAHLEVHRSGASYGVRLVHAPPVGHHRPSVDVLFESCARHVGPNAVAAILTGMGADGARGRLAMRLAGARTIAQDGATCVVYGMPKEAAARGAVEQVLPLDQIAAAILRALREPAPGSPRAGATKARTQP